MSGALLWGMAQGVASEMVELQAVHGFATDFRISYRETAFDSPLFSRLAMPAEDADGSRHRLVAVTACVVVCAVVYCTLVH